MTTPYTAREFITGPLYFFDQPSAQDRRNGTPRQSNILHFSLTNGKSFNNEVKTEDQDIQSTSIDTCVDIKHDETGVLIGESSQATFPADATVETYRRAAPQLLAELARLLSQHRWAEEGGGPRGLQNILHHSWLELTAGALYPKPMWKNVEYTSRLHSKSSLKSGKNPNLVPVNDKIRGNAVFVENTGPNERRTSPKKFERKTFKSKPIRGCIVQPKLEIYSVPEWTTMCQWVLKRVQAMRIPINIQAAKDAAQGLDKPPVLRHYGDHKPTRDNSIQGVLPNGMPQIPEVKKKGLARYKLHYSVNDGSSTVYYSSGHVAVCQSHSGLAQRGFCTNVFSDKKSPIILASITAFGHGTVTHPLSGFITARWDQAGGVLCDPDGTVTKRWSWPFCPRPENIIVIQVSDLIWLRLLSSTAGVLIFKSCRECVRLPLSALTNQEKKQTCPLKMGESFFSETAQALLLAKRRNPPTQGVESRRTLSLKSGLQVASDAGVPAEPSELRRGRGHAVKELSRIQQRIHSTVDDWLAYLCMATGIQCPVTDRSHGTPTTSLMPGTPSADLPSMNPPGQVDVRPREGGGSVCRPPTHPCAPVDLPLCSALKLPSSVTTRAEERPAPRALDGPEQPSSPCPAVLRAALVGDRGRRVCHCSSRRMPVVTDLEYDAFVMRPPPHSEQILLVCVTPPSQGNHTPSSYILQDVLEKLYESMNKHRTSPCFQCKMDSFRLVRYEMPTGKASSGQNTLLKHRHHATLGMTLMYIRGRLLFADYICSGYSCSVKDLHKQISRTRADYRQGLSLPPDYKFSAKMQHPAPRVSLNPLHPQKPVTSAGPVESSSSPEKGQVKVKMWKASQDPGASL